MYSGALSPAGSHALARLQQLVIQREEAVLNQDSFLARALPAIADGLDCDRVSLWVYTGGAGELRLHCRGFFTAQGATMELPTLVEADHPAYFGELDRAGVLRAPDALRHTALASMRDDYLRPNDIRSLLDVPFAVNGRRIGLLCGEQTGRRMDWQPAQVAFMRRAGITCSLLFHRLAEAEDLRLSA